MGKYLDSFNAYLKGSRSPLADVPEMFPPVDLDYLRNKIRIEQRAKTDAANNFPPRDAKAQSAVELEIKGSMEEIKQRYMAEYDRQLSIFNEKIFGYASLIDLQGINNEFQKKLGNLKVQAELEFNRTYGQVQSLKAMAGQAKHFRMDNGLEKRLPNFPPKESVAWAKLAVLVILELILNFFLLRESGDVLQVTTYSLLYGLINVVLPFFLAAEGIRYVNHINPRIKMGGVLALLFFIAYMLWVNLMMAHYRGIVIDMAGEIAMAQTFDDSLMQRFLNMASLASANFRNDWFGLSDIWSWFLLFGGCALSLGGVYAGYKADDRYPGYGELARQYDSKYSTFLKGAISATSALKKERDMAADEIDSVRKAIESGYRKLPSIKESAIWLKRRCLAALERLNTDYKLLVQEYRQTNRISQQSDGSVPDYFEDEVQIEIPEIVDFKYDEVERPKEVIESLQGFADALHSMFDKLVDKLESTKQVLEDDYPFRVT